ncbi:MAG: hypothetical protein WBG02_06420 [Candidatus Acidiferrum sp.]
MKNVLRLGFTSLAGLILVGGVLALPSANSHKTQEAQQTTPQTQSVSGKIASVEKDSFTLTIGSAMEQSAETQSTNAQQTRTMAFAVDKNTTIEGTLKVGSSADVTYRQDSGVNVAISVHVTP